MDSELITEGSDSTDSGLSTGATAGIVIAVLIFVAVAVVLTAAWIL